MYLDLISRISSSTTLFYFLSILEKYFYGILDSYGNGDIVKAPPSNVRDCIARPLVHVD